jgi:hypothetical protein
MACACGALVFPVPGGCTTRPLHPMNLAHPLR